MEELVVPYLNGFALALLIIIIIGGLYLVIYIHDIPYNIAKKRNHPHKDAFHAAGYVSLLLMHAIWPLLWIWAYWYDEREDKDGEIENKDKLLINQLQLEIDSLKSEIQDINSKQE